MTREEAIKYLNEFILFKKISNITEGEVVECFKLAVEALQEYQHYKDLAESYEKTINKLTKAIAEQQQKAGHWTHDGGYWENRWICSECGYKLYGEQSRFCPDCGIKMEEEKNERKTESEEI